VVLYSAIETQKKTPKLPSAEKGLGLSDCLFRC